MYTKQELEKVREGLRKDKISWKGHRKWHQAGRENCSKQALANKDDGLPCLINPPMSPEHHNKPN